MDDDIDEQQQQRILWVNSLLTDQDRQESRGLDKIKSKADSKSSTGNSSRLHVNNEGVVDHVAGSDDDADVPTVPPVLVDLSIAGCWDRPGAISVPGMQLTLPESNLQQRNSMGSSSSSSSVEVVNDVQGEGGNTIETAVVRDSLRQQPNGDNDRVGTVSTPSSDLHVVAAQLVEDTSEWHELNALRQAMASAEVAIPVPTVTAKFDESNDNEEEREDDLEGGSRSGKNIHGGKNNRGRGYPNRWGWFVCCFIAVVVVLVVALVSVFMTQRNGSSNNSPVDDAQSRAAPTPAPSAVATPGQVPVVLSLAPTPQPVRPPNCIPNVTVFRDGQELRAAVTQLGSGSPITSKYGSPEDWCVSLVEDFSWLFANNAIFYSDIQRWDTSRATTMRGMFFGATDFNPTLSYWNTSRVTDMSSMFQGAIGFDQNLTAWDTSSVTNTSRMFADAFSFNGNISTWDTSQIVDMEYMFFYAKNFDQDLSLWNTARVRNMAYMFAHADNFTSDISSWDTSNVLNMSSMFYMSTAFDQDISTWNVSSVRDMTHMFNTALSFSQNLCTWGNQLSDDVLVDFMFSYSLCPAEADPDLHVATPGPFCMYCVEPVYPPSCNQTLGLFRDRKALKNAIDQRGQKTIKDTYGPIEQWCVGLVEDFSWLFDSEFNADISQWDTSSATTMEGMFYNATIFNQDISGWNTSRVSNMHSMFEEAHAFNQNLSAWNTRSATTMLDMFFNAVSFNGDVSTWDTSKLELMSGTLTNAVAFNQDISRWDTSRVTHTTYLFFGAESFDQDLSAWNTSRVLDMSFTFMGATSFNHSLSSWDISKVMDMQNMFDGASSFAQNLCSWGSLVVKGIYVTDMFVNTSCPTTKDPAVNDTSPGPFCFPCE